MLQQIGRQIRDIWTRMSMAQRVATLLAVVAVVGTIALVTSFATRPQWGLLYADMDEREGGTIVAKLQEWGIPYDIRGGGNSVWIERDKVSGTKMRLGEAGLTPVGDLGYAELFDNGASNFGRTEFQNQVTLTRAQQGELNMKLKKLPFIRDASVMIAKPQPTLFVEERKPVTASVMVDAKFGRLSPEQVFALANYVAASVPGLEPENVMLVDARGRSLNGARENAHGGGQLDVQQTLEETLVRRALDQLFAMVGPEKASVQVTAQLDFEKSEETTETIDPESGVPLREKIRTESTDGGGPGGVSSVDAVLANADGVGVAGPSSTTEDSEIDYMYGKSVKTVERSGASIKRLTVSVVADQAFEERAAEIETLVRNAVGFEAARGDEISVAFSGAFVEPEPLATEAPAGLFGLPQERLTQYLETLGAIVVLVVLFLLVRPVLKRSVQSVTPPERMLVAGAGGAAGAIGADGLPQLSAGEGYQASPTAQLTELIDSDPEKVANIMKNWVGKEEV